MHRVSAVSCILVPNQQKSDMTAGAERIMMIDKGGRGVSCMSGLGSWEGFVGRYSMVVMATSMVVGRRHLVV